MALLYWLAFAAVLCVLLDLLCRQVLRHLHGQTTPTIRRRSLAYSPDSTANRRSSPRARKKPDWVLQEVLRLKALLGHKTGCRQVAKTFNRLHQGSGATVGKTFVSDAVRDHQLTIACLRRDIRNRSPLEIANNHTWATDLSFFTDGGGQRHALLGLVDHGSRLCLTLKRLTHRTSWALLGHLCLAIAEHGKPRFLRTDNEAVFNSRVFRSFLRLAGINKQTIPTASPWCNGRIERLFGTLKPWLKALEIAGAHTLQSALDQSRWFYNHVRPHHNLQGLTPWEKWQGLTPVDLKQTPITSVHELRLFNGVLSGYWIRR